MIDETIARIREMRTHSESTVAVDATLALEELLDRDYVGVEEFERDLERNAGALRRSNLSHALLHTAMQETIRGVVGEAATLAEAKALLRETIDRVVDTIERSKHEAAANAAERLADGETVLTHENSTTVMETLDRATDDGKSLTVYVTETRPRYIGRLTVRELADREAVDAHLITDGAAGYFMTEVDRVLLGMNCIVDETYYNRIGTFPLCATASVLDRPVTVVAASRKIVDEGFVFENEDRSPSEVLSEPAEGFTVENPAYDATPLTLVDTVVTESGFLSF
jgi:translation initiation factor eIF-2B subunit delta